MLISTLETLWTFSIAYPTAVSLGKILLQTAPERAPSGQTGPMEAFLRAMREVSLRANRSIPVETNTVPQIERHPQVIHLPAPHLWQLTLPRRQSALSSSSSKVITPTVASSHETELVATVEMHVRPDLSDSEVLELTKWARDKCSVALGRPRVGNVTVAVVRG